MSLISYRRGLASLGLGLGLSLGVGLAVLAQTPDAVKPAPANGGSVPASKPGKGPTGEAQVLRPSAALGPRRTPELPSVELTGELLFQILASEIAAQRGASDAAAGTLTELAIKTRDPRLARRALEFSMAAGDFPAAYLAAQAWSNIDPQDPEAKQAELSLAAASGRVDGLGGTLRERIRSSADKPAAIARAQRVLVRIEDKQQALKVLETALTDVRDLPESHIAIAQAAGLAGDTQRGMSEARAALALRPQWEFAAMLLLQFGIETEPDRALEDARKFLTAQPEARDLRLMVVRAFAQRQDYVSAQTELAGMAKRNPEDFEVLYLQGLIAYQAGQVDQAKSYLNQFLAIQSQRAEAGASDVPDPTNVLLLLADIAEQQKQPDEAFALLGRIEDPEARLTAQLRQAVLRGQQGDVESARQLLRAIPASEDREIALVALTEAQVLRRAGQTAEVISVLEAANKRLPDTPDVMYELAMLYEREGRTPEMESLLRRLIVLQPNHAHAFNALGYSLADRNERLDEARTLIEKALSLSPDDAFILDSMGWVYYRQGNNSQALYYLRRAYSIRQDTEIAVHLGEVLWVSGQRDEARSLWQDASRQEPANASLRATLARLGATL